MSDYQFTLRRVGLLYPIFIFWIICTNLLSVWLPIKLLDSNLVIYIKIDSCGSLFLVTTAISLNVPPTALSDWLHILYNVLSSRKRNVSTKLPQNYMQVQYLEKSNKLHCAMVMLRFHSKVFSFYCNHTFTPNMGYTRQQMIKSLWML